MPVVLVVVCIFREKEVKVYILRTLAFNAQTLILTDKVERQEISSQAYRAACPGLLTTSHIK